MADGNTRGSDPETALNVAIQARLASLDSGNYRANNRTVLNEFQLFLKRERDVTTLEELEVLDCRRYAQWLRDRVQDDVDNLSAASAHDNGPYFTIVRAFLGWCVDDERLDTNPARPNRVKEALPEYRGDRDRQFWSRDNREELLDYVNDECQAALDGSSKERRRAFRNRAVVTMLALTGARSAELFADPRDDHRNGLRWSDVNLDEGVAMVFGKTREVQAVPLLERVQQALEAYRNLVEPSTEDWPVFSSHHHPSVAETAREGLRDLGWSETEIESEMDTSTGMEVIRNHELTPPPLSKNGARTVMKQLCDDAGLEIDGEYLKPHGGRRGLGSDLYEKDPELAQELLRHESIETTHESYRKKNAVQRRERLKEALDE